MCRQLSSKRSCEDVWLTRVNLPVKMSPVYVTQAIMVRQFFAAYDAISSSSWLDLSDSCS